MATKSSKNKDLTAMLLAKASSPERGAQIKAEFAAKYDTVCAKGTVRQFTLRGTVSYLVFDASGRQIAKLADKAAAIAMVS